MTIRSVDQWVTVTEAEIGIEIEIVIETVTMTNPIEITNLGMAMEKIIVTSISKTTIETIAREILSLPEEVNNLFIHSLSIYCTNSSY